MKCWSSVDNVKSFVVQNLVDSGAGSNSICSALFGAKKSYHAFKLTKSLRAKKANIRSVINKRMKSFEVNKGYTIRSVLECPFHKVVLNHLVVNDDLILEPDLVMSKKHCNRFVLDMLLVILNFCLSDKLWEGVLTNTHPIALIETACKILSDRISSACSAFDVLHGDNFSLWLVLQNMQKAYDLVGWIHLKNSLIRIKIYSKFIHFFGNIYNDHTNWIITDFGLTDGYYVHNGLDQGEVFSPLLWQIFYDPLLCEVKRQESVCRYRLNSHFISKNVGSSQSATQHILNVASKFFWINDILINNNKTVAISINSRVSDPFLSISSLPISITKKEKFHQYLDIFLSTESLSKPSLVRAHSDVHFFTNLVLKKAVSDKQFLYLVSTVLHPIVSYKTQFSFVLVGVYNKWDALICKCLKLKSGLLLDFLSNTIYHSSFYGLKSFLQCQSEGKIASLISFVNSDRILGCLFSYKSHDLQILCWQSVHLLVSPARIYVNIFNNFLAGVVHIFFDCKLSLSDFLASSFWFYGGVPMFVVFGDFVLVGVYNKWDALICKCLKLKSGLLLDFLSNTIYHSSFYGLKSFLQCQSEGKIASLISFVNSDRILGCLFSYKSHDLQILCWQSVHLLVSPARIYVNIFNNFLAGVVHIFFDCKLSLSDFLASSFWFYGGVPMFVVFGESLFYKFLSSLQHYGIRLDPHGLVPEWFKLSVAFLVTSCSSSSALAGVGPLDICGFNNFLSVCDCLSWVNADSLSVYMDGSLKNLDTIGCRTGAAVFFEDINLGLGVGVQGLVLFTLMELQAIALALECMPAAHSVYLFLDNQAALDACRSEFDLMCSDFHNWCWHKIKSHSGILGNNSANSIANATSFSGWYFSLCVSEHFLLADGGVKISSGSKFLDGNLHSNVNWLCFSRVWHPDLHIATGFTSRLTADTQTYFMKTLYHQLSMAVRKHIYNKCYSSVLCLYCGKIEMSDHVFSCVVDDSARHQVLESCIFSWEMLSGLSLFSLGILQLLSTCALDFLVFLALYKGFVFNGWLWEVISIFPDSKVVGVKIADFVQSICLAFRNNIWLVHAKYWVFMEKNDLIPADGSITILVSGLVSGFSAGVIKLLVLCVFLGIGNLVSVNIST
ncbi:hypothetical protein G9A89_020954 [Geosiphon pyriformis]|nr:hypothetical protein G9A89_020954 [Geosiphon pyriformis]